MTIAFAIFSAFPAFQAVQGRIEVLLFENLVPEVGSVVREHISEFSRNASNLTALGVGALAVSAVLLLSTIESVFTTIWRVDRERPLATPLLLFWTVLTLGPRSEEHTSALQQPMRPSLTTDCFKKYKYTT